jgi:hypothetical protein
VVCFPPDITGFFVSRTSTNFLLWSCGLVIAAILFLNGGSPASPSKKSERQSAAEDSATAAYWRSLGTLTSPELEGRKARRTRLQREGYAEVLQGLLAGDDITALLSWIRTRTQLEYSIPSRQLYVFVYPPAAKRDTSLAARMLPQGGEPIAIPLYDDRSFPIDPWQRQSGPEQP